MMLSMSMTLSPIMSFAEIADNPDNSKNENKKNVSVEQTDKSNESNEESKIEDKNSRKEEKKIDDEKASNNDKADDKENKDKAEETNPSKKDNDVKGATLTLKSGSNGYLAIVNKDKNGKAKIISSGKEEKKANIGDVLEIAVYGKNPKVTFKGIENIEKSDLPEKASLYKIKITDKEAEMSVTFDSSGPSILKKLRRARRSTVTSGTITYITGYGYGNVVQGYISVSDGGEMFGVCCERPNSNVPTKGNRMSLSRVYNDSALGRVAYYGYLNSGDQDSLYATSAAATCIRGANQGTKYGPLSQRIEKEARNGTLPTPPSSFECYVATSGSKQAMLFWRDAPMGKIAAIKTVAENKDITDECSNMYSLSGAEYTVYSNSSLTSSEGTLRTYYDGTTNELELETGRYYVKETKAPDGYALDPNVYTAVVESDETTIVESAETPLFDPVSIVLKKVAEGKSYLNTNADMSGAEFEISYYDEITNDVTWKTPKRVWKLKTIRNNVGAYTANLRSKYLLPGSDEFYRTEEGIIVIPRGTISIRETKAPKGYKVDPRVYTYKIDENSNDHFIQLNFGATPEQPNKPLVPKIWTSAISENTKDEVGEYGEKINLIDKVSYKELSEDETYTIKGKLMDKDTGKPLLVNGKEITSEKTFTVTKGNSTITGDGASGSVELTYEVDSTLLKGKTTVVYEKLFYDGKEIAKHEDINDRGQTIHFPDVKTTATTKDFGTRVGISSKNERIKDVVKYTNLVPGKRYTVKGILMDKETGKPFLVDGKEVRAEKTFTPSSANGTVELEFIYDSTGRNGHSTVVFEDLYHNGVKVGVHNEIEDEGQTIAYPNIKTTARDKSTKDEVGEYGKKITIIDTVYYENCVKDFEYTLKGILMDAGTGEPVLNEDGSKVVSEKKFKVTDSNSKEKKPLEYSGTIDLEFEVDSTKLPGKTTVVYEKLFYNGKEAARHEEINDKGQSTFFPHIRTSVKAKDTGKQQGTWGKPETLIDTVKYKNLVVGKEYTVKGILMDKKTNAPLLDPDGKEVRAEKTFTPTEPDGSVDLEFHYNSRNRQGKTTVVFEDLYHNGVLVGTHTEITDKEQSVSYPDIKTKAKDKSTKINLAEYSKEARFVDTISYKSLALNKTYTFKGKLMDRETGKPIKDRYGREVTASKDFIPTKENSKIDDIGGASGDFDLEYIVDSTILEGKTTVFFEKLYFGEKDTAKHEDIKDKNQTIHVAKIRTNAKSKETNAKQGMPRERETIIDKVRYENLIPGKQYKVKGKLMDKDTGKPIKDENDREITAEKTFTPEKASGFVNIEFTYNSLLRQGKTTVVFEDLYYNNIKIAVHADINDEEQRINYPDIKTTAKIKQYGKLNNSKFSIVDTISYKNLATGREYTLKGILMDRKTGKPFLVDGKEVRAEKTFTPKTIDGSINMEFELPSKVLENFSVVVFEDLYNDGIKIATHSDLRDKGQTISVGKLVVYPGNLRGYPYPITGDKTSLVYALAGIIFIVIAVGGIIYMKKQKDDKADK